MSLRILAPLALVFLLACGSGADPKGAALPAPWTELNLPVQNGTVEESGPTSVHIAYKEADVEAPVMAGRYAKRIIDAGWTEGEARKVLVTYAVDFTRDGKQLTLMVSGKGKRLDVQLEME